MKNVNQTSESGKYTKLVWAMNAAAFVPEIVSEKVTFPPVIHDGNGKTHVLKEREFYFLVPEALDGRWRKIARKHADALARPEYGPRGQFGFLTVSAEADRQWELFKALCASQAREAEEILVALSNEALIGKAKIDFEKAQRLLNSKKAYPALCAARAAQREFERQRDELVGTIGSQTDSFVGDRRFTQKGGVRVELRQNGKNGTRKGGWDKKRSKRSSRQKNESHLDPANYR